MLFLQSPCFLMFHKTLPEEKKLHIIRPGIRWSAAWRVVSWPPWNRLPYSDQLSQLIFTVVMLFRPQETARFFWRCGSMRDMASSILEVDSSGRVISSSQKTPPYNTQHLQETNIHSPGGILTHNLSRRAAADPRLRPLGHRDRQTTRMLT